MYLPQITIAAINGPAVGGGFELAIAPDFRLASEKAIFQMPEAKHGYPVGWSGLNLLPKLVGVNISKEILLMAEKFDAQKALRWGLINKILSSDNFMEDVKEFANEFARRDPVLTQMVKYACNRAIEDSASQMSEMSDELFHLLFSKDKKTLIHEFRQKTLGDYL